MLNMGNQKTKENQTKIDTDAKINTNSRTKISFLRGKLYNLHLIDNKIAISTLVDLIVQVENIITNKDIDSISKKIFNEVILLEYNYGHFSNYTKSGYHYAFGILCQLNKNIINDDQKLYDRYLSLLLGMSIHDASLYYNTNKHCYYNSPSRTYIFSMAVYSQLEDLALAIFKTDINVLSNDHSAYSGKGFTISLSTENKECNTILECNTFMVACGFRMTKLVNYILDNYPNHQQEFGYKTSENESALMILCRLGMNKEALKLLNICKNNIWDKNNYGKYPFHYAIQNKMKDVVITMLDFIGHRTTKELLTISEDFLIAGCIYNEAYVVEYILKTKQYGFPRQTMKSIYDTHAMNEVRHLFPKYCDPENKEINKENDKQNTTIVEEEQREGEVDTQG